MEIRRENPILLRPLIALVLAAIVCSSSFAQSGSSVPSLTDVRLALENRIGQQSEGRIQLIKLATTAANDGLLELNGEVATQMDFRADVEVLEPCFWAYQFEWRPLTFKTFKVAGARGAEMAEKVDKGERLTIEGYVLFVRQKDGWKSAGFGTESVPKRLSDQGSDNCIRQMKMIGLSFRIWEGDNNDHTPFNVSTNAGGSMEWCDRAADGFDRNAFRHFQVMSNELSDVRSLICPGDSDRKAAANFTVLGAENVSYKVRSGTQIDSSHPQEILMVCPLHGHVLFTDGSVKPRGGKQE